MKKQKVIAICGSPRKGNTEIALKKFLEGCKKAGAQTEIVLLRKKKLKMFDESSRVMRKLDREMEIIVKKMIDCDLVVFGIPVFYSMPPALFKNFIDKTAPLYFQKLLKNKLVFLIVIGEEKARKGSSLDVCIKNMKIFCNALEMKVVGEMQIGELLGAGEIMKNKRTIKELVEAGKNILKNLKL